jgi:uncharacterized protein YndB with AHSA1/START domain
MVHSERSIIIARPPKDVYAYVSRTENEPQWHTDVLQVKRLDTGPVKVGTRYDLTFTPMMGHSQGTLEVTKVSPPVAIETEIVFGPMRPHVSFRFEPEGAGTRVTRRVDVAPPGMMKLMPFMMKRMVSKKSERFLANLKAKLESGVPRG